MNRTKLIVLLLITGLHLPVDNALAQEQISILNAERAEGGTVNGERVRKLLGNVRLSGESMAMEADSAYQYESQNRIDAFNIRIDTEQETIWADTLYYNTLSDLSRFRGRVILSTENHRLFSQSVDFDSVMDLAIFHSPVRFEDQEGVLLADSGHYFQERKMGIFRGDVQLADSSQYLEADSLYMDRRDEHYQLFSRVFANDFEEKVTLAGDYLEADSSGERYLEGEAWMMQVNESEADTTHLNAHTIHLTEIDTTDYIDAVGNVRIRGRDYAAIADTAHYRSDLEQFRLISEPIIWQKRIQLTGPYIEILFRNDEIHHLNSHPRPIVVMKDSLTGRFNQMRGDTLHAWFERGEIDRITVFNNSELIFHLKDEEENPDGLIQLIANGPSTIEFLNGEPEQFKAEQNVDGSHLPEEPENINRELSDFRWDPDLRPEQPEIQVPRLPEVPEELPFEPGDRYLRYLEQQGENGES